MAALPRPREAPTRANPFERRGRKATGLRAEQPKTAGLPLHHQVGCASSPALVLRLSRPFERSFSGGAYVIFHAHAVPPRCAGVPSATSITPAKAFHILHESCASTGWQCAAVSPHGVLRDAERCREMGANRTRPLSRRSRDQRAGRTFETTQF